MDETLIAILILGGTGLTLGIGTIVFLRWHERKYPGRRQP